MHLIGVILIAFLFHVRSYHIMLRPIGFPTKILNRSLRLFSTKPSIDKPKVVFILGGPGSGKGTQCEKLSAEYGIKHLSAGDLLRQEMTKDSADGKLIDDYLKRGQIVPVSISLNLLKRAMQAQPCYRFLIDGFPRNQDNLDGWNAHMKDSCHLDTVLFIDCDEKELQRRVLGRGASSGRSDDNLETAKRRFTTYERDTMPIIQYFSKQKDIMFSHIDSSNDREVVFDSVKKAMEIQIQEDIKRAVQAQLAAPGNETATVAVEVLKVSLSGQTAQVHWRQHCQEGPARTMQQSWEVTDCMWRPASTAQPLHS